MNRYALYNQNTKMSYGPFISLCRNHYVSTKNLKISHVDLGALAPVAVVDMNGSVILVDAIVVKIEIKKEGRLTRTHIKLIGGTS